MTEEIIPLDKCENRRLYRICSRNLAYGVFSPSENFYGIREKFGTLRVDTETHWDFDDTGTALPMKALPELLPTTISFEDNEAMLAWLQEMEAKYGVPKPERGSYHAVWPMGRKTIL